MWFSQRAPKAPADSEILIALVSLISCFCLFVPYRSLHFLWRWEGEPHLLPHLVATPCWCDVLFSPQHLSSCFAPGLSQLSEYDSCFTHFVENLQVHKIVFIRVLENSSKIRSHCAWDCWRAGNAISWWNKLCHFKHFKINILKYEHFKVVIEKYFLRNFIQRSKTRSNKYSSL